MLENAHTLDADYIYRDFKELVVELGYFTKEELTDEVPEVLAFPVVDIGSYQYPDRKIDKRENEYGTMIHSEGDIASNVELLNEETVERSGATKGVDEELEDILYKGYSGYEAVVSPVTGILLEYGTYDSTMKDSLTDEQYRVNVDLKYGPIALTESPDGFQEQIVSDKVGYAKILVLDVDNYLRLERLRLVDDDGNVSTNNTWMGNSLYNPDTKKFREDIIASGGKTAEEKAEELNDLDEFVYGFKEFTELYETVGIAGYTVIIDGFVCEEPDPSLIGSNYTGKTPVKGTPMSVSNFKSNYRFRNGYVYTDPTLTSLYKVDDNNQLASVEATDKLKAENIIKRDAIEHIYFGESDKYLSGIFIKEGTVLGRTMTDEELRSSGGIRESSSSINDDAGITGNYIRMIMRDLDGTPVEDIEDMIKKDTIKKRVDRENVE
jgi:hypothetical protein